MGKLVGRFILGEWEGPQGSLFAKEAAVSGVRGRLWWGGQKDKCCMIHLSEVSKSIQIHRNKAE